MAPGCPHLKITVCVRHLSKQKLFWCPRDATMLGWCALLSYLNPDAALAFPKLQEVSRGLFLILICFACISAFSQTVSQKIRIYPFHFCFLNLFFFFPPPQMISSSPHAKDGSWSKDLVWNRAVVTNKSVVPKHPPTALLFSFMGLLFLHGKPSSSTPWAALVR